MNEKKKYTVYTILLAIAILTTIFVALDWSSFFSNTYDDNNPTSPVSLLIKAIISLLSVLLVFLIGNDGINKRDTRTLMIIYSLILFADFNFIMNNDMLAIIVFGVVQILLIIRNGWGFVEYLIHSTLYDKLVIILSGIITYIILSKVYMIVIYPYITSRTELFLISAYAFLVGVSFFIGWVSLKIKYFPTLNCLFIAIGMTFFLLCDVTVGINILYNPGLIRTLAAYLTWIFYTPALVLMALSGYKIFLLKL